MKSPAKKIKKSKIPFSNLGLGRKKAFFIENMAMLLSSGMDVLSVFEAIKQELRSKKMKALIDQMIEEINDGSPLWRVLENANIFPTDTISLIKLGEQSGQLIENLKVIVIQQQKERIFKSKIRSAMLYPVLVFSLTVIIGIGITWFILPKLAVVFAQIRVELPLFTRVLLALGDFLGSYGVIAVPIFVGTIGATLYFLFGFPKTKFVGQKLLFSIPGTRNLIREVELGRFGYIMGTLLNAGIPIVEAINSLHDTTSYHNYKKFYFFLKESTEEGNSFQQSFDLYPKTKKIIPVPIQQMIAASAKSGNLPDTLLKIGEIFEEKTDNTTKNLTVVLEPILLVIVWLVVLAVALAVITPIYNLVGSLNQSTTTNTTNKETTPTMAEEITLPPLVELPKVQVVSTVPKLNVRSAPSFSGSVVTQIAGGEIYEYSDQQADWYQIILPADQVGWVVDQYVTEIE